jgi:hypothetical protein
VLDVFHEGYELIDVEIFPLHTSAFPEIEQAILLRASSSRIAWLSV